LGYVLGARLLHLDTSFFADDSKIYDAIARSLLAGQGWQLLGAPSAFVGPVYPMYVAVVYKLFGFSLLAIGISQSLLGALTVAVIARTAGLLRGLGAAWAAGLIAAVYPHLIFWTGHLLTETLFVFLAMVGLWLLCEAHIKDRPVWYLEAGLVLGLGALTRPQLLAFVPVAFAVAWAMGGRKGLARGGAIVIGTLALIVPWTVRNATVVGIATPVSTESPFVMWQGNSPGATGGSRGYVDDQDFKSLPLPPGITEAQQYHVYSQAVRDYLTQHPLSLIQRIPAKLWNQWRPVYAGSSLRNWLVTGVSYLFLVVCAAVGLVFTRKGEPRAVRYPQFFLLTLLGMNVIVTGMIRFRLPMEAAMAAFAGITCAWLWTKHFSSQ